MIERARGDLPHLLAERFQLLHFARMNTKIIVDVAGRSWGGREMMQKCLIVLAVAALADAAGGCGDSDGDGGMTSAPPADVAGKWLLTVIDPLSARYIDCTEDAIVIDDATIWAASGGGTVAGNQLTGQLDLVSDRGWSGTESFSGSVSGGLIVLQSNHVKWTGTIEGECRISPGLVYEGEIRDPDKAVRQATLSTAVVSALQPAKH